MPSAQWAAAFERVLSYWSDSVVMTIIKERTRARSEGEERLMGARKDGWAGKSRKEARQ